MSVSICGSESQIGGIIFTYYNSTKAIVMKEIDIDVGMPVKA